MHKPAFSRFFHKHDSVVFSVILADIPSRCADEFELVNVHDATKQVADGMMYYRA